MLATGLRIGLLGGCAMHQKKVMHTLENPAPVNCATADGDLRVLQSIGGGIAIGMWMYAGYESMSTVDLPLVLVPVPILLLARSA